MGGGIDVGDVMARDARKQAAPGSYNVFSQVYEGVLYWERSVARCMSFVRRM